VSSGLRFYIEKILAPWRQSISALYALDVDVSGEHMCLRLTHDHPTDAMPKERVMAQFPAAIQVAIGDAGSDVLMAKAANIVFARSTLLREMQNIGKPCYGYEDFFDIKFELEKLVNR
jgi:2-hydroxy-3-keto-5-methylthiopentenyl-1-phosphate phosphatase